MSEVAIRRIDPASDSRWGAYVERHPDGSPWHSAGWIATLEASYRFRPEHLAAQVADRLVGVLPLLRVESLLTGRRLVSLPFSGPAGPLADDVGVERRLVDAAIAACSGGERLELRVAGDRAEWNGFVARRPAVVTATATARPAEEILSALRPRLREDIERALRNGVTVSVSRERPDLDGFYRLFILTARRHGVPPQPRSFFDELWRRFALHDAIRLFETRTADGELASSQIVIEHGRRAIALYVGTDYRHLGLGTVKLADWECLRWATERGLTEFEWGLTDASHEGLRFFKRGFAGVERPFEYRHHPAPGGVSTLQRLFSRRGHRPGGAVRALARALPAPLLTLLGQIGYRHVA